MTVDRLRVRTRYARRWLRRPVIISRYPNAPSRRAVASPIPEVAPVIMAVFMAVLCGFNMLFMRYYSVSRTTA